MPKRIFQFRFFLTTVFLLLAVVLSPYRTAAQTQDQNKGTDQRQTAIFAGGCFWCVEEAFEKTQGVIEAVSGFTGGTVKNPAYKQVASGKTDHIEAVKVIYDSSQIDYSDLLVTFWQNIDPHDAGGQFCDRGAQYGAAIFVDGQSQRAKAQDSKTALEQSGKLEEAVVTPIREATAFYPAEEYHQDYYKKRAFRYNFYKTTCGRPARLEEIWSGLDVSTLIGR